jgi:aminomethyltransferase
MESSTTARAAGPTGGARATPPVLRPDGPRVERHRVRPGGALVLRVAGGDVLRVRTPSGGQPAEATALTPGGAADLRALGRPHDAPATVLRGLLRLAGGSTAAPGAQGTPAWLGPATPVAPREAHAFLGVLHAAGLRPEDARSARLLGPGSAAGAAETLAVEEEGLVVVAAPAGRVLEGDAPPTELVVEVHRATAPAPGDRHADVPPPLAQPRIDVRIDRASALAYEVFAGEHVQIIDVAGRQCSDLVALHRGKLEGGLERDMDMTTTRSLMGRAYPEPGLHGKFYDVDMQPLLEVVQDTVGRHDTFALACTARYYDDAGYPGHVNCSDNFNAELTPFGVAPRQGWSALNLFYNTSLDANLQLAFDEPWSRPGDHVLLKAHADLLCASSACPDDVDPANGWDLTEVHLRVYPAEERFQMAIAHRATVDAEPEMTVGSGFAPRTSALTKRTTDVHGVWIPTAYDAGGAIAEHRACRERVAIMDLSQLRKFDVAGPDAETLLQHACTRDVRRLAVGQVVYTALCDETGAVLDDATVFRLGDDAFRLVGGDPADGAWLTDLAAAEGLRVRVRETSDVLHNVAVQGPRSRDVLEGLIWSSAAQPDLADLRWFRFLVGRIGGFEGVPVVVSRTGYTGELGYEIFCHPDDAPAVWDAVLAAGAPHGIAPLGLDALELLRIEAGLVLAGHEFGPGTGGSSGGPDPWEAGIGFTVDLGHDEPFVGREALEERAGRPRESLVGLALAGGEVPAHGDGVFVGRRPVGVVTSACRSPEIRRPIALARVAARYAEAGTALEVGRLDGHLKRLPAEVVPVPFYDPRKERPRS